jgi:hypothetical protein
MSLAEAPATSPSRSSAAVSATFPYLPTYHIKFLFFAFVSVPSGAGEAPGG